MQTDNSFEKMYQELENLVHELEQQNFPLEEMVKKFQRAHDLTKKCQSLLNNYEKTVTKIVDSENQETNLDDFQK